MMHFAKSNAAKSEPVGDDGEIDVLAAIAAKLTELAEDAADLASAVVESAWVLALSDALTEDDKPETLAWGDEAMADQRRAGDGAGLSALVTALALRDSAQPPAVETEVDTGERHFAMLPLLAPSLVTVTASIGTTHDRGEVSDNPYAISLMYVPSDSLFPSQWHLNNTGQSGGVAGVDLNLLTIWDEFTGAGVNVGIWDDGVQYSHPDLVGNYNAALNILNGNGTVHDALPQSASSAHGTSVAGVIAAENDGNGTVGVAFNANITGVDMFYDPLLFVEQSTSQLDTYDVTNHSWGYTVPFAANILSSNAYWTSFFNGIANSVIDGRGGLGTINLVAAGNDRTVGRDSNDSNFTNMPQTISVAAVGHDGVVSWYSTPGAANLVAGPSNGPTGSGIWTTDRTGADGYSNGSNEPGNTNADYTNDFGGTSSATPAVTGVVALMLEANPLLGWRDVQDILAMSARHTGTALGVAHSGDELYDWVINGATNWNGGGMHFSNDYGFGLVDAFAAVRLAETWTEQDTSANWEAVVASTWTGSTAIPDNTPAGVSFNLTVTATTELEHVGLKVEFDTASFVGDYLITLTSPSGTISYLSRAQNNGDALNGDFFLSSNAFRGEDGVGTWTVNISDRWTGIVGTLEGLQLEFYGKAASADDIYVFTDEYSALAGGAFGHDYGVIDTDGGEDTFNLSALTSDSTVVLGDGGIIDGINLGSFASESAEIVGIENVIGGDGNDSFTGDGNENSLSGMRGDDVLTGGGAYDRLYGGAGNDTISGGTGTDELFGGIGNDLMTSGTDNDTVYGGGGNDLVDDDDGVLDADYYLGGTGVDTVQSNFAWQATHVWDMLTGAISNTLLVWEGFENYAHTVANAARLTVLGTDSANAIDLSLSTAGVTVDGRLGDDIIQGGTGNDSLAGGGDNDSIYGGDGNDIIRHAGGGTDQRTDAGDGDDTIYAFGLSGATHEGGAGNDLFIADVLNYAGNIYGGTGSRDRVDFSASLSFGFAFDLGAESYVDAPYTFALQGIEDVTGGQVGDTITGSTADNILDGQGGNDTLTGGNGNDTLLGGGQFDTLFGGSGNDVLNGNGNADSMDGGSGDDIYSIDSFSDIVTELAAGGIDEVRGLISINLLTLSAEVENLLLVGTGNINGIGNAKGNAITGNGGVNVLNGEGGADTINGGAGNDTLNGGDGNDTLNGSADNDVLNGGNNDDLLNGGAGVDVLSGGNGNDTLIGANNGDTLNGNAGNDTLTGGTGTADTFVFQNNWGVDTITDFEIASATEVINLAAVTAITSFADLTANHLTQSGLNAVITVGVHTITLTGITAASLTAAEFSF